MAEAKIRVRVRSLFVSGYFFFEQPCAKDAHPLNAAGAAAVPIDRIPFSDPDRE